MYWLFESEQPYDDECADSWLPDCRTVQGLSPSRQRHRVSQKNTTGYGKSLIRSAATSGMPESSKS
jgi:hypothetical protein